LKAKVRSSNFLGRATSEYDIAAKHRGFHALNCGDTFL
jgi:hypothetical protein